MHDISVFFYFNNYKLTWFSFSPFLIFIWENICCGVFVLCFGFYFRLVYFSLDWFFFLGFLRLLWFYQSNLWVYWSVLLLLLLVSTFDFLRIVNSLIPPFSPNLTQTENLIFLLATLCCSLLNFEELAF